MNKRGNAISVKTSPYFPKTVKAIGAVFFIFGLAMIWTTPVIGALFIFIASVISSTHYGFEINSNPNSFREFVWVLGWKEGKKLPFKSIEFLFIQPCKFTFLTYGLREKTVEAFEGYIKFEGRNEVEVLKDVNKDRLVVKLTRLAEFFNVDIRDYSDGNPITIFQAAQVD